MDDGHIITFTCAVCSAENTQYCGPTTSTADGINASIISRWTPTFTGPFHAFSSNDHDSSLASDFYCASDDVCVQWIYIFASPPPPPLAARRGVLFPLYACSATNVGGPKSILHLSFTDRDNWPLTAFNQLCMVAEMTGLWVRQRRR